MSYKSPIQHEVTVIDRFGEERTLTKRSGKGYQIQPLSSSPSIVLTKEVGVFVGQSVKAWRERRGWTLADLCIRAGIRSATPKSRMWEIENSLRRQGINLGTVYALAMALDVEITDLLPSVAEMQKIAKPKAEKRTVVAVEAAS